jgi:hypothetical protein
MLRRPFDRITGAAAGGRAVPAEDADAMKQLRCPQREHHCDVIVSAILSPGYLVDLH